MSVAESFESWDEKQINRSYCLALVDLKHLALQLGEIKETWFDSFAGHGGHAVIGMLLDGHSVIVERSHFYVAEAYRRWVLAAIKFYVTSQQWSGIWAVIDEDARKTADYLISGQID